MDVHGQSKLHVAGLVCMNTRGEDGIHDGADLVVRHVDGEARHFVGRKRAL